MIEAFRAAAMRRLSSAASGLDFRGFEPNLEDAPAACSARRLMVGRRQQANAGGRRMSRAVAAAAILGLVLAVSGCESRGGSAALGGLAGAAAGAGGYEYHLNNQKNIVEQDFAEGKIDRREHEIRIDQIRRDSAIQ
jgi:hypothetical protein